MPIPIQNFYTGQGASVVLPEGDRLDRAVYNAQRGDMGIKEAQYSDAIRREKQLLDLSSSEAVDLISSKNAMEQAEAIENFNNLTTDIYREKGGNLSTVDLMNIKREQDNLQSWQLQKIADQKRFERDYYEWKKNPGKYDNKFAEDSYKRYMDEGKYEGMLKPARLNRVKAMSTFYNNADFPYKENIISKVVGGETVTTRGRVFSATEEDQKKKWEEDFLSNDNWVQTATEDFSKFIEESPKEAADFIAKVSEFGGNPVIEHEWEYLKENGLVRDIISSGYSEKPDTSGGGFTFNFGGGKGASLSEGEVDTLLSGRKENVIRFSTPLVLSAVPPRVLDLPEGYRIFDDNVALDIEVSNLYDNTAEVTIKNSKVLYKKSNVPGKGERFVIDGKSTFWTPVSDTPLKTSLSGIQDIITGKIPRDADRERFIDQLKKLKYGSYFTSSGNKKTVWKDE